MPNPYTEFVDGIVAEVASIAEDGRITFGEVGHLAGLHLPVQPMEHHYLITEANPPLDLPLLYQNDTYAVYDLADRDGKQ